MEWCLTLLGWLNPIGVVLFKEGKLLFAESQGLVRKEPPLTITGNNWGRGEGVIPTDVEVYYPNVAVRTIYEDHLNIGEAALKRLLDEEHITAVTEAFNQFNAALHANAAQGRRGEMETLDRNPQDGGTPSHPVGPGP